MMKVILEFWTVDRRGRRTMKKKFRQHERAVDAVRDAWQFRPAKLSERGVLTVQTGADEWTRFRVRVDGLIIRASSWRALKEIARGMQEFPAPLATYA